MNFSNVVAAPRTPAQINTLIFSNTPGVLSLNNFIQNESYGRTSLAGIVEPWSTTVNPESSYSVCSSQTLQQEALSLWDSSLNYNTYRYVIVVTNTLGGGSGCGENGEVWSGGFSVEGVSNFKLATAVIKFAAGWSDTQFVGATAHEFGHMTQALLMHPSGYADFYDQDDTCGGIGFQNGGPCHATSYSKSVNFDGWLGSGAYAGNIVIHPASTLMTYVIRPLEFNEPGNIQAVKIPVQPNIYYLVEVRRLTTGDDLFPIPDQGVLILRVNQASESAGSWAGRLPVTVKTPSGTSASSDTNLWHVGQTYDATATDGVKVEVLGTIGQGFQVRVTTGAPSPPDVMVTPWLTAPLYTWETRDIWIDSYLNGYDFYQFHEDGDFSRPQGNGDMPWVSPDSAHPNRVYVKVTNIGTGPATGVTVHVEWANLNVATPTWNLIGTATPFTLAPGASASIFVPWAPTAAQVGGTVMGGVIQTHVCVRVRIDPVPGETVLNNQDGEGEQENINYFKVESGSPFPPVQASLILGNPFASTHIFMIQASGVPDGWKVSFRGLDKDNSIQLSPQQTLNFTVIIDVPPNATIGDIKPIQIDVGTVECLPPPPKTQGLCHIAMWKMAGATLAVDPVKASAISIGSFTVAPDGSGMETIEVHGTLTPAHQTRIALLYTAPDSTEFTEIADTLPDGSFSHTVSSTQGGTWRVQALWTGDEDHSPASAAATSTTSTPALYVSTIALMAIIAISLAKVRLSTPKKRTP